MSGVLQGGRARRVRVVIADDHELTRAGLRALLAIDRTVEIVGEAANGREAIVLCRSLKPDLVLMDVRMPELDGVTATRQIKAEQPATSVIMVTMHEDPDYLLDSLKAGASGYLLKDATQKEISAAIRAVVNGDTLLNPELATRLLKRLAQDARPEPSSPAGSPATTGSASTGTTERLTARELDVLSLLIEGLSNREIAERLVLSVGTVKTHVEHIIGKLGVSDRTQAAVRAIDLGLVRR